MSIEALKAALDAGPVAQALLFTSGYVSLVPFDAARLLPQEPCDLYPVDVDTIRALLAEREALLKRAELWRGLYRRAVNEANGLTNYVEDRPELRRSERNLTAIEAEARAAMQQEPTP